MFAQFSMQEQVIILFPVIISGSKIDPMMTIFIEQGHYILLTSHSHFYFLHENCLEGLSLPPPSDLTDHLIRRFGVISEKPMHCVTRRANNRFKIPANTRFYRVKVKPHPTGQNRFKPEFRPRHEKPQAHQIQSGRLPSFSV